MVPQFLKPQDARIALALARAEGALAGIASLSNHAEILNAAQVGPAAQIEFTSAPFTARTGKVRVSVWVSIAPGGGTVAPGDSVGLNVRRDSTSVIGAGMQLVVPTGGAGGFVMSNSWDDTVTPGTSHFWGALASCSGGHTISYPSTSVVVLLQELPG